MYKRQTELFVEQMNTRAKELGMTDTHFVNCTGLPAEGHVTSAWDIALMSRELIEKRPDIRRYTTIWMDTLRDGTFQLANTNKLIRFYDGATGLKTGSTDSAKYCLSATAEREGMELIAVVLKSSNAAALSGIVFLSITVTHVTDASPWIFAWYRASETLVGIAVGIAVNAMNSLASAFCILFLFWTITHLARRLVTRDGAQLTAANTWAVLGAGAVGALAYTFTDTFWFSAVEGEVYALSSMFTALVVWLMLKWENRADNPGSDRYLVLIAYVIGVSIAVHLLNLLCIPALVLIFYFRKWKNVNAVGALAALAVSCVIVGAILYGLVPGLSLIHI